MKSLRSLIRVLAKGLKLTAKAALVAFGLCAGATLALMSGFALLMGLLA